MLMQQTHKTKQMMHTITNDKSNSSKTNTFSLRAVTAVDGWIASSSSFLFISSVVEMSETVVGDGVVVDCIVVSVAFIEEMVVSSGSGGSVFGDSVGGIEGETVESRVLM